MLGNSGVVATTRLAASYGLAHQVVATMTHKSKARWSLPNVARSSRQNQQNGKRGDHRSSFRPCLDTIQVVCGVPWIGVPHNWRHWHTVCWSRPDCQLQWYQCTLGSQWHGCLSMIKMLLSIQGNPIEGKLTNWRKLKLSATIWDFHKSQVVGYRYFTGPYKSNVWDVNDQRQSLVLSEHDKLFNWESHTRILNTILLLYTALHRLEGTMGTP